MEIAEQLIRSSAIDIIVVDSVAALTPKAEIEGDMGDNKVGLQARLMSQALRKLTAAVSKTRTTCIFINQLREKIGVMFGNPETTTGGNALKFYASVRLDIRGSQAIKNGDEVLGKQTKVKVVKNIIYTCFYLLDYLYYNVCEVGCRLFFDHYLLRITRTLFYVIKSSIFCIYTISII